MSPAERAFWLRAQRRASTLQPDINRAILRAFELIRDSVPQAQLDRIIASGNLDELFRLAFTDDVMDQAFAPVRDKIRNSTDSSLRYFAKSIPNATVDGTLVIAFDMLNPRVIDAVRALDTKIVQSLKADIRETVMAYVENGLRDGVSSKTVARELRSMVGLSPTQEQYVRNQRAALETAHEAAGSLNYKLRDRRFDRTITKARETGVPIPQEQIDRINAAYRKRFIAYNAETNARTAALDSMKLGQRLSYEDAIAKGIVDRDRLMKQRIGVDDDRERPEHVAINNEIRHFDEPYSNGEMVCGDSTYNCRCLDRYFQRKAA